MRSFNIFSEEETQNRHTPFIQTTYIYNHKFRLLLCLHTHTQMLPTAHLASSVAHTVVGERLIWLENSSTGGDKGVTMECWPGRVHSSWGERAAEEGLSSLSGS